MVTQQIPFYLIFPKGNYMLAKVRAFVDYMREEMRDAKEPLVAQGIGLAAAV